jgi:hypothetical protein
MKASARRRKSSLSLLFHGVKTEFAKREEWGRDEGPAPVIIQNLATQIPGVVSPLRKKNLNKNIEKDRHVMSDTSIRVINKVKQNDFLGAASGCVQHELSQHLTYVQLKRARQDLCALSEGQRSGKSSHPQELFLMAQKDSNKMFKRHTVEFNFHSKNMSGSC